jgi:hypothetical protein
MYLSHAVIVTEAQQLTKVFVCFISRRICLTEKTIEDNNRDALLAAIYLLIMV